MTRKPQPTMAVKTALSVVAFIALNLAFSSVSYGQIKSGVITGTVSDANGDVIPGASVSVVQQGTNVTSDTVTNDSGIFTVPYLAPGAYTVIIEKPSSGFAKYSKTDIPVSTAQTVQMRIVLEAGVTASVSVAADAAALQSGNATVQGLINERTVQSLPNITHNPFSYAALQAGVVPRGLFGSTQNTTSFGVGIDGRRQASAVGINGGSAFSNDVILDGVSIQGSAWNETAVLPNMDALQEVRVITNNFTAEYGRAQGVVIFTTKSGSNEFHGSGFYRIRNEALNANSFLNNAQGINRLPFKSHTFGGTVGGPIVHDKAFFFVSYEGLRFRRGYPFLLTVPTAAERRGDFSNTYVGTLTNPQPIRIYDPFSVTPSAGNFLRAQFPTFTDANGVVRTSPLPMARLNQHGLAILNAYPLPNRTPNDIFNTNNFFFQGTQSISKNNINSRVDYHRGTHSFYWTYGFQKGNIHTPRSWGDDNPYYSRVEFVGNQQPDDNPYFAFGDTVVFTPTLILDARIGVNRINSDNEVDTVENYDYNQFGIPAPIQAINNLVGATPAFSPGGNVSPLNFGTSLHKRERQTNTDFNASMTWTRGSWTHKFGGTYRVLLSNYIDVDDSMQIQTAASFTQRIVTATGGNPATPLSPQDSGSGLASILLGAGNVIVNGQFGVRLALAQKYTALYSQNDWRVNKQLTLNLGMRWDIQEAPTERFNNISAISLGGKEPLFGTPGEIVFPGQTIKDRHMWETEFGNFGPRLGIAWQANDATVFRGGYGLTYVPSNTGFNDGPGFYGAAPFKASAIGNPYGANPAGLVVGTFDTMAVNTIVPPVGADPNNPRIYGGLRRFPRDYKNGYVQQWNAFVERKIGNDWIASAGYIGSRGSRLQVVFVPINSNQLVDQALLDSWRSTYIATNGVTNVANQTICNPYQTLQTCNPSNPGAATGPLIQYNSATLNARQISRINAAQAYPLEGDNITLSVGTSEYHAMQLALTRQFAGGLQVNAHYTWSKQIGTTRYNAQTNQGYSDGGENNYFPNRRPDLWKLNRKLTTNDTPHRLVVAWIYDIPFGKGSRFDLGQPILNGILGGWRLGGSITAQSGFVFPLTNGGTNSINNLPDRVPGVPLEVPKELQRWYDGKTSVTLPSGRVITPCNGCFLKYNIDAFAGRIVTGPNGVPIADIFWYGNAAATYAEMRSNSFWNTNMSLERSFKLGERYSVSLSAQATNLFNNVEFRPGLNSSFGATVLPSTVTANPTQKLKVGQLLDTANTFGTFRQNTYDARQIEFVMKLRF